MIYLFLADGFEEVEALTPADMLRRCGKDVIITGVGGRVITGSHGITVTADITDSEIELDDTVEMIILPGGMPGTLNLKKSAAVQSAIDFCVKNGIYIAAICAAPSILGEKGLLSGRRAVCFEGYEPLLMGAEILKDDVCCDGQFITARGAGLSLDFALKLVEVLISGERSDNLAASLMLNRS